VCGSGRRVHVDGLVDGCNRPVSQAAAEAEWGAGPPGLCLAAAAFPPTVLVSTLYMALTEPVPKL
jgi:hypothetical protein